MIDREIYAEIRRLFFAEHWRVGTIVAELGVHHDTVTRAIEAERFAHGARPVRPTLLDPYKAFIADVLEQHPQLRCTRLFEMVAGRGYPGSVTQLRKYVATVRPARRAEAFLLLRTLPGEQAQVDWGYFGKIKIGAASRLLSCFVMVLSFSRAVFARFTLDQTLESFLRGHVRAFQALGGVPRAILYDNLKSVVLERHGEHVRYHPQLLELAGHYHFAPKPCAPYRGNEKGKVERTIQYLRHAFFAARRFASVADLNAQLEEWVERVAHARAVPGDPERIPVGTALEQERKHLLPLPEHPFGCDLMRLVCSGKRPYVRFDLNDYSIPHELTGKSLTLLASEDEVRFVNQGGMVLARHDRSYDRGRVIEAPEHIRALAEEKRRASELRGRDRLRSVCPTTDAFLEALCTRGTPLGTEVRRLGQLIDRYGAAEVELAMHQCLERRAVSAASVAHVVEQRAYSRRQLPPVDVVLPADPRVRDLRVKPHELSAYDALSKPEEADHGDVA